mmetsp:Transcript_12470/g.24135  ORF Transcript_12470/g.24135 Transcript_12470/m.24135 type:complete len:88 (+) Transcript_12470:964-1227(+)
MVEDGDSVGARASFDDIACRCIEVGNGSFILKVLTATRRSTQLEALLVKLCGNATCIPNVYVSQNVHILKIVCHVSMLTDISSSSST